MTCSGFDYRFNWNVPTLSRAERETAIFRNFATIQGRFSAQASREMHILYQISFNSHFCRNFRRDCHLERSKLKIG